VKKILVLTYYFTPSNFAGSYRIASFAKHLHKFGYYPVVITRQCVNGAKDHREMSVNCGSETIYEKHNGYEVYYLPYKGNLKDRIYAKYGDDKFVFLRKLLSFFELIFQNIFIKAIPYSNMYFFAKKYLKNNPDIKFVLASGSPFNLFFFCYKLSKKIPVKWIANYRDEWNSMFKYNQIKLSLINKILYYYDKYFEKKWVSSAALLTTVSETCAKQISEFCSKPCKVVMNGVEYDDFNCSLFDKKSDYFSLSYVGTLNDTQPVEIFLDGYKNFIKYNNSTVLYFFGVDLCSKSVERIKKYNISESNLITTARLPKEELFSKIQNLDILIMFGHIGLKGAVSSKIFEYMATGKYILLCPGDNDDLGKLLKPYSKTCICNTAEEVEKVLCKIYELKLTGKTEINETDKEYVKQFTREKQAEKLAKYLDGIIKYQQCNRCVMDTSDSEIMFDDNGYCNHCKEYLENTQKKVYQGETSDKKLAKIVEQVKKAGKNNNYDCIVGVSGGIDSSYVAYITKKLGLRVLAVNFDNGWNTETSVENIENIVTKLGFDYQKYVMNWEEFKDLQVSFLKSSVVNIETPTDHGLLAALHKIADKYRIKYIFSGGNYATEGILPKSWEYDAKDIKQLKAIHKKFGTKKLKTFPTIGLVNEIYFKYVKGIKMIYLLNYVPYDKNEAMKVLEQELDWKYYGGKHYESIYTKFVQSYILPEKFGIDRRRTYLSTLICSGQITRDEALIELTKKPYDTIKAEEDKEYICKKLDMSLEEFNKIMNLPVKTYKDYPNNEKMLKFIYNIYFKLNL